MRDLRQQLGVASQCGRCATCAKAILDQETQHAKAMQYPMHQHSRSTLKRAV
ncbi:(2Fe-2S)-binding protein [Acidithiobacillus thiooxidans ATCC 19377]|uniref:(2Fe-2S)-binding protein n=3 Tax=Acidithiobacillaceae TaxID=225058 RepID=A0A5P9XMK8_ACITH|nr:(2Fe-2S)-binding protein [Acidithiobacillus thiooxidans ATCC 19377]